MQVTTKAFCKDMKGYFCSRESEDDMNLDCVKKVFDIPSTAQRIWFKLSESKSEHSLAVKIEQYPYWSNAGGIIEITPLDDSRYRFFYIGIYSNEFRGDGYRIAFDNHLL